jgi:hypothetical protein
MSMNQARGTNQFKEQRRSPPEGDSTPAMTMQEACEAVGVSGAVFDRVGYMFHIKQFTNQLSYVSN